MVQNLFIFLLLANSFLGLAIASDLFKVLAPINRKLGGHHLHQTAQSLVSPSLSPSMAPVVDLENLQTTPKAGALEQTGSDENVSVFHLKKHHKDKSVAGGGVILGGLGTTFLVAVFCYIKATGRHKAQTESPTN